MLRITLRIDKNRLSVKNLDFVTSGCVNSATCVFMFGDEWEPYQKTAAFACDGVTYHVSIRDNACMLPNAVMQHRGEVLVGIIGIDTTNNKTVTTNNVRLRVIDGADKDAVRHRNVQHRRKIRCRRTHGDFLEEAPAVENRALCISYLRTSKGI